MPYVILESERLGSDMEPLARCRRSFPFTTGMVLLSLTLLCCRATGPSAEEWEPCGLQDQSVLSLSETPWGLFAGTGVDWRTPSDHRRAVGNVGCDGVRSCYALVC